MAVKKTAGRGRKNTKAPAKKQNIPPKKPLGFFFWIVFIAVIVALFAVNRETISRNLQSTRLLDRLLKRESTPPAVTAPESIPETVTIKPADKPAAGTVKAPAAETPKPQPEAAKPPAPKAPPETPKTPAETPKPAGSPAASAPPPAAAPAKTPETKRDRALYFMKVDADGTIVRTKVNRPIAVSDSPMADVLDALLQGPTADEKKKGLTSLIPPGTRLLSALVRGSTAYISFSEDFQFNTYGVEGYAAQLRQIVWTITEFQNVKDVQFLIEGRRIDYLGEGIGIGIPLSRDNL